MELLIIPILIAGFLYLCRLAGEMHAQRKFDSVVEDAKDAGYMTLTFFCNGIVLIIIFLAILLTV